MKKIFMTAVTILAAGMMLPGKTRAQQTPAAKTGQSAEELKTPKDKLSYAIGLNVGRSLQKDSVAIDPDVLVQGLERCAGGRQDAHDR